MEHDAPSDSKLIPFVFTAQEVCTVLKISAVTLWRLEKRGLLTPVPDIRHKRYSVDAVRRFANAA